VARNPDVDDAVLDVTGYLLRPEHRAADALVINLREVRAGVDRDMETGAPKQVERGDLERSLRQSQLEHGADSEMND